MKKLIYLTLSVVILFVSCYKPKCCVLPKPVVITAQKNGINWQLPIIKSRSTNDIVFIATVGPYLLNTANDSLTIHLAYKGLGNYKPTDSDVSYTVFSNGTKINYMLDTTANNSINITEYAVQYNPATTNPDPTEIKATFNLRFIDPAHTTSVNLSGGKFTAYLSN